MTAGIIDRKSCYIYGLSIYLQYPLHWNTKANLPSIFSVIFFPAHMEVPTRWKDTSEEDKKSTFEQLKVKKLLTLNSY
ncbi:hypothetical protein LguiA_013935 [Lonicera macranthoides]